MRALLSWTLLLGLSVALTPACGGGGDDEADPPPAKKKSKAGAGGASGNSAGGDGNQGGFGNGNPGGSSQGGFGNGNPGGSSQGGFGNGNPGGSNQGGFGNGNQGGFANGSQGGEGGQPPEGKCFSKVDCDQFPDRPLCDLSKNLCVECLATSDCTKNPDRAVCDTSIGACVECLSDADCTVHPNGPHCRIGASVCTCKNNSECVNSAKGKLCDNEGLGRCGECITAFDCKDAQKPGCTLDDKCFKGDLCQGDDPEETGDDGPLGAIDVTPAEPVPDPELPPVLVWEKELKDRHVCDLPIEEVDWYKFTAQEGDTYTVSVEWDDPTADLDLVIMDGQARLYGYDYFGRPATVTLTYLPPGLLYAFVYRSTPPDKLSATTTPYTLRVKRSPHDGKCLSTAQCAAVFDHQLYRGVCDNFFFDQGGVCRFIEGNGKLENGSACDDDKDCKSGNCSYQPFTRNAHARSFCTPDCAPDANPPENCPDNQRCATYLLPAICVAKCSTDDECHASISDPPPEGQPWTYYHCNTETGACEEP